MGTFWSFGNKAEGAVKGKQTSFKNSTDPPWLLLSRKTELGGKERRCFSVNAGA